MSELFLPNHPDAPIEMRHLQTVCDKIEGEITRMEHETGVGAEEERVVAVPEDATMDEMVALDLFRRKVDMLRALGKARHQAYFARLDFIPQGAHQETHYLGRWGVVTQPEYDTVVVDWRAPLANLYYSGQVGPVSYDAPDGSVRGEMTLKRLLTVRDRQLSGIFDSGLVSQDAYLQSVLGQVSGNRLKEIVTTIQAEQNQVIRHGARENLIVQGVAGSGKTTIALHRIAWLLYAFRETLKPEQLMILAPNPLFLDYISQVLPDLGVERVIQTTFAGLCEKLLGKALPKLAPTSRLEDKLTATPEQRESMKRVLRRKGSLTFKRDVESFLDLWQKELIPQDLTFGNVRLMTRSELENIFLTQLKPFPLEKRIDETKKYVKKRLTSVCEQMKHQLLDMTETRLTHLLSSLPDGEERRARAAKLFASRDERMREVDERAKQYLKDFRGLWPSLKLCDVYAECLRRTCDEEVCAATLPYVEKNKAHMEDLAALAVIGRAVVGIKPTGVRHVLVDECQDFSPFQVMLLREVTADAAFTLVGDLMQGVHDDEGITGFDEWIAPVFDGHAALKQLVTGYRSTIEIMATAAAVAARHPVEGRLQAKSVLRHGDKPLGLSCASKAAFEDALTEQVNTWQAEGFHTIALIAKTADEAAKLHRALNGRVSARLFKEDETHYEGGVLILPASLAKGLEFDCVIVCGADAEHWADDAFLSRVMYVLVTRPLHRLAVAWVGERTALIPADALDIHTKD